LIERRLSQGLTEGRELQRVTLGIGQVAQAGRDQFEEAVVRMERAP
jgi:hypothetical protein